MYICVHMLNSVYLVGGEKLSRKENCTEIEPCRFSFKGLLCQSWKGEEAIH